MTEIKIGNPATWIYVIQNEGVAVDITGFTVRLVIKKNESDADSAALFDKTQATHSDPTNGTGSISMTEAESVLIPKCVPYYCYRVYDGSGNLYKEYPTLRDVEFVTRLYTS